MLHKKRDSIRVLKQLKQLPAPIQQEVFQKVEYYLDPFLIMTPPKDQLYEIDTTYGDIYPKPKSTETALLSPQLWAKIFDSDYRVKENPYSPFILYHPLRPSLFYTVHEAPRDITLPPKAIQCGPNKNNLILRTNGHNYFIEKCLYVSSVSRYLIRCKDWIGSWFKPVYSWGGDDVYRGTPYCYASALAPQSDRYAIIATKQWASDTWDPIELIIYDLIKQNSEYTSKEVARTIIGIPNKATNPHAEDFVIPDSFHDLTFVGGRTLFCVHNWDLYRFKLNKDATISCKKVLTGKVFSFTASHTLPIGFFLKASDDQDQYADLYVVNLVTQKYKKIKSLEREECPHCYKQFLSPYRITCNDSTIGINFSHWEYVCSGILRSQFTCLKTIPIKIDRMFKH